MALLGVLAVPLPRDVGTVTATVKLQQVGNLANVEVTLNPPDAAKGATAFAVSAWQGGSETVQSDLRDVGKGRYVATKLMPVTGKWKTMVSLQRGNEVMAVPIYLPARPPDRRPRGARGARAHPSLRPQHHHPAARDPRGPATAAIFAYSGLGILVASG